jgi:hypothetical protein
MEPWKFYLDRLGERVGRMPSNLPGREDLIAEAAHDAYQSTANRLTSEGWDEEDALTVTRMFGQAVREWIDNGSRDWDELAEHIRALYERWSAGKMVEE